MRTRTILTLSASLAVAVLSAAPTAAQSSFRDDGSVIVNRGVLESLEPRLKRPTPGPSVKLTPPASTSRTDSRKAEAQKGKPAKVADSAKPQPSKPTITVQPAPPQPGKTDEVAMAEPPKAPAKPAEMAKPAPAEPAPSEPAPAKVAEPMPAKPVAPTPVKPAEPAPAKIVEPARPATTEPPRTRLVGPLTDPDAQTKLAAPIMPQGDVSRTLPSAAPAGQVAAAPAPTRPAAPAPMIAAPAAEAPAKVAAMSPPLTDRGLVTPQRPAAPQPPAAQPPARAEPATSRAGRGATIEQRDGSLRLLFPANEATLPEDAQKALEAIARRLETEHNLYIQLLAYAEGTEDEASKARRLSLSRALAVRSYLMNDGVRSTRIEVRALGHKIPDGPADRVDVVIDKRY